MTRERREWRQERVKTKISTVTYTFCEVPLSWSTQGFEQTSQESWRRSRSCCSRPATRRYLELQSTKIPRACLNLSHYAGVSFQTKQALFLWSWNLTGRGRPTDVSGSFSLEVTVNSLWYSSYPIAWLPSKEALTQATLPAWQPEANSSRELDSSQILLILSLAFRLPTELRMCFFFYWTFVRRLYRVFSAVAFVNIGRLWSPLGLFLPQNRKHICFNLFLFPSIIVTVVFFHVYFLD